MSMSASKQHAHATAMAVVERFEAELGDPLDGTLPFSYRASVTADECEQYPEPLHALLRQRGFDAQFVPAELGGELRSFETFCALFRCVARRDLTLALGHGISFVGSLPIWVGGTRAQQERAAALLLAGERFAFMLTERDHGSDLQKNELRASEEPQGYSLTGEKWLINNATLSRAFTLVARSGPNQLSVFFVDKLALAPESFGHLPKVKTLGVRGLDISGISLDGARVGHDALIGDRAGGFEVVLKALQVSRALSAPLCLGPLDTCLRATLDFALSRVLYGRAVSSFPHAQKELTEVFLDALLLDCMGIAVTRAVHVAPEQLSVWASVQKYFVPTRAKAAIDRLSVVLGARHYLREEHWEGIFQKMARDVALVSLFDGSTVVNLSLLAAQLPDLSVRRAAASKPELLAVEHTLSQIFDLSRDLPALDLSRLRPASERDDIAAGLTLAARRLEQEPVEVELKGHLVRLVDSLRSQLAELDRAFGAAERQDGRSGQTSPELFALAERHCLLHAAGSALQIWLHNRQNLDRFVAAGEWLALVLARVSRELGGLEEALPPRYAEHTFKRLVQLHGEQRQFSLLPIQLGRHEIVASQHTELAGAHQRLDEMAEAELAELEARLAAAGG